MGSDSRWHRSDCGQPSVVFEGGLLRCRSCGATPSELVDRLIAQSLARGGEIHLPEDTPLGEANLWWPPSVPYHNPQVDFGRNSRPYFIGKQAATAGQSNHGAEQSSVSPIYPSSLDAGHFRLIYITESKDVSSPIHIRLIEHDLKDHPEYETVSYVWGGEDGDSTQCKPVYVGPFWDVVLATRNCSSLLHYLRPQRGCRIIWLDAICINQADNIEKPTQVSQMADIYANCERVVAYLGEDLVSPPIPESSFRPRIDFRKTESADPTESDQEKNAEFLMTCAKTSGMNQDQLFERRYLTRIWIVQELLLSKQAMLPLGCSDILCDREQARRLILRTDQEQLYSPRVTKSLSLLLKATAHCHASDPRDRVFGLLGLFRPQHSRRLKSDYSLSWRDCWVGTAAYLLLVEKNLVLLLHAVGNNRSPYIPSWLPDIQKAGSWFVGPTSTNRDEDRRLSKDGSSHKPRENTASGNWNTEFVLYSVEPEETKVVTMSAKTWWGQQSHRLVFRGELRTLSTESASIDSSSAALQIQVIRVFNKPCQLTMDTQVDGITSIWVRGASAAARFRVMGLKGTTDPEKSYQLFVISHQGLEQHPEPGKKSRPTHNTVLLAMTVALPENQDSIVTLHECCVVYDIHFYTMTHLKATQRQINPTNNARHSVYQILHDLHEISIRSFAANPGYSWIFASAFPSPTARTRDILPLMIFITKKKAHRKKWPEFAEPLLTTAKSVCPDFDPHTQGNFLYLKVKDEAKFSRLRSMWENRRSRVLKTSTELPHRYQSRWDEELQVSYTHPLDLSAAHWKRTSLVKDDEAWNKFWDKRKFPFFIRFSFKYLVTHMWWTRLYTTMLYAREFSKLLKEDLKTFLSRIPGPEDRYVFFGGWGRRLGEELGLVWKLDKITIV